MKQFIVIIILLFIVSNKNYSIDIGAYSKFSSDKDEAIEKILSTNNIIQKNTYRDDANSTKDEKWLISREYYNSDGKIIKFEAISEYGAVVLYTVFSYNEEGLIVGLVEKDNFHTIIQNQQITYDAYSRVNHILSTGFNDVFLQKNTYEYIDSKSIAIETIKDSADAVLEYTVMLYDKPFNKIIKQTQFTELNEIDGTTVISYSEDGISAREVYSKDTSEPFVMKYQNVYNNHLLSKVQNIMHPNNIVSTVVNEYNDFGLIEATKMFDANENPITTLYFEYLTQ